MEKARSLFLPAVALFAALCFSVFARSAYAQMLGCDNDLDSASLFSVDTATGAATFIGALPVDMTELVYDTVNGRLYAQGSDGSVTLYQIDPATGAVLNSVSTGGVALNGMEFVNGVLYGTAINGPNYPSTLVTVDPATGTLTPIGLTGMGPITGLAYNKTTGIMYGMTGGTSSGTLVTINLATGAATVVGPTGLSKIGSIEFGSDDVLYGGLTLNTATMPGYLVRINTTTGVATPVGDTGYSITGLALIPPPAPVPTLSGWGLILFVLFAGLGSAYFIRRRARA